MPLPAPVLGLPAPSPGMPAPSPSEELTMTFPGQAVAALAPTLAPVATPFGAPPSAEALGQPGFLGAVAKITGGAVDSDPREWTPGEAAAQTERALARIGQVNPELARALQEKRAGAQAVQEPDRPWWEDLKDAAADVLSLPVIKQVVDLISRPGRVVAEILADEEGDSVWENTMQALAGKSDKGFGQVLDKYDILTGDSGFEKFVHNALAFGGDVVTDPLTYLTFGGGALSRRVVGIEAARAAAKTAPDVSKLKPSLEVLASQTGRSVDDLWSDLVNGSINVGAAPVQSGGATVLDHFFDILRTGHNEAVGGAVYRTLQTMDLDILTRALGVSNEAYKLTTAHGWGRASAELAGRMGVSKAAVEAELKNVIGAGRGFVAKSAYQRAKAASAVMGQPRFRMSFAIPGARMFGLSPFGFRWVTHRILPFDLSKVSFQVGRRFMAGLAGEVRLGKMVANEAADPGALRAFWDGGYTGLRKHYPQVAQQLGLGSSVFMPLSEQIGRATKRFSPHAEVLRGGGFGASASADAGLRGKLIQEQTANDVLAVEMGNGRKLTAREATHRVYELLRPVRNDPEKYRIVQRALDEVVRSRGNADTVAILREQLGTGQADELIEIAVKRAQQLDELPNKHGLESTTFPDVNAASSVRLDDVGIVQAGTHEATAGRTYAFAGVTDESFEPEMLRDTSDDLNIHGFQGVRAEAVGEATGRSRDALRVAHRTHPAQYERAMADLTELTGGRPRTVVEDSTQEVFEVFDEADEFVGGANILHSNEGPVLTMVTPTSSSLLQRGRTMVRLAEEIQDRLGWDPEEIFAAAERGPMSKAGRGAYENFKRRYEAGTLRALRQKDPRFVVRLRNPATEQTVRKINQEALRELEEIAGPVDPRLHKLDGVRHPGLRNAIENEATRRTQVADITTERLKEMGHDGFISQDGSRVAVFWQGDGERLWRLADDAPAVPRGAGPAPRVLSDDVVDELRGVLGKEGVVRRAVKRIERAISGKRLDHAENIVRVELQKLGAKLPDTVDPLELDIAKTFVKRANDVGRDVADQYMGRAARRVDALGWTRSAFHSGPVGIQRWKPYIDEEKLQELDKIHGVYRKAEERVALLQAEELGRPDAFADVIERLEGLRDRLDQWADVTTEGGGWVRQGLRKQMTQAERKFRRLESLSIDIKAAVDDANKMRASLRTAQARPMAALEVADDAMGAGMARLDWLPGFQDMAMPKFMEQELWYASRGFKSVDGFHREWRKWMSWWKTYATYVIPGFHIRNAMGAWFNNMLQGVGLQDYILASRVRRAAYENAHSGPGEWSKTHIRTKDRWFLEESGLDVINGRRVADATYGDLADALADVPGMQVGHGLIFGEAHIGLDAVERAAVRDIPPTWNKRSPRTYALVRRYKKYMRAAGAMTENIFRTASMVRGLADTAGDWMGARSSTMMRHGDYADLTDFEYGWVRDGLPFYKWMRTNTPLQIHQLLEAPGKLLALSKAQRAVWGFQGMNYDTEKYKLPDWMRDTFTVPFGKDDALDIVTLDLPTNDLFIGMREFASSFLPLGRPLFESLVTQQETFTGKPLEGKPVPISWSVLNPLLKLVGLAEEGKDGKTYMDDRVQNVMATMPLFSRFRNWLSSDPKRVQLRGNSLWSSALGVGLRPVDAEQMASTELDFYYNNVLPELDRLREMGYPLPTTDDLAAAIGSTDTILENLGIDPTVLSELR